MGNVKVKIIDVSGSKEKTATLPDDQPTRRVIQKLVQMMKLPATDPGGQMMSYKFVHKSSGKQISDDQTLSQVGVREGDVLRLQPEITAG